jgi:hypothetical protein
MPSYTDRDGVARRGGELRYETCGAPHAIESWISPPDPVPPSWLPPVDAVLDLARSQKAVTDRSNRPFPRLGDREPRDTFRSGQRQSLRRTGEGRGRQRIFGFDRNPRSR